MIIKNVYSQSIRNAIAKINEKYDGNIITREFETIGRSRSGYLKFKVKLAVKDSRGAGSGVSFSGRRTATPCWHVHGEFFDALPDTAVIEINSWKLGRIVTYPGDEWQDELIGDKYHGYKLVSELCDCATRFPDNEPDREYNGWRNYETWNVAFLLANEQWIYTSILDWRSNRTVTADETQKFIRENFFPTGYTGDNIPLASDKIDWQEIADGFNEWGK
jgi:hypothetical protein